MGYCLTTSTTTRQTVLSGSVDSNGYANFLSAGTGLAVDLDATPTPLIVNFAQGFNSLGTVDYYADIDADQTISSLTASTTNYIYVDRNPSTEAITYGHTTLVPDYGYVRPSSPSTGQHHFNIPIMTMEVYNGTSWEAKQRVFLGEAVTDADSVTSVITYALRGQAISDVFSVSNNSNYTKNLNLGITPEFIDLECLYRNNSSYAWMKMNFNFYQFTNGVNLANGGVYNMQNRNQAKIAFPDTNTEYVDPMYSCLINAGSCNASSGQCLFIAKRRF